MRRYVGVVIVALLVGAGCWFFGLDVVPSIVVALVVAGLGITLGIITLPLDNVEWPPAPPEPTDGARREVSELTWSLRTPGGVVGERNVERVRRIADTSLRRRHLDLDNPAHRVRIERLIGAPLYALLNSAERHRVSLSMLLSELGILEALEKSDPASRN
jgi:hypothetical protein